MEAPGSNDDGEPGTDRRRRLETAGRRSGAIVPVQQRVNEPRSISPHTTSAPKSEDLRPAARRSGIATGERSDVSRPIRPPTARAIFNRPLPCQTPRSTPRERTTVDFPAHHVRSKIGGLTSCRSPERHRQWRAERRESPDPSLNGPCEIQPPVAVPNTLFNAA